MSTEKDQAGEKEEVTTSKLVVRGNVLAFDSTAYQISNLAAVSVREVVTTLHHTRPKSPFFWAAVGGLLIWLWNTEPSFQRDIFKLAKALDVPGGAVVVAALATMAITAGSIISILSFKRVTSTSRVFLSLELNSGRQTLFHSNDKEFMVKAATAITHAMAFPRQEEERIVLNFDNKTINVGKAENSNIIGGNVSESIVGSI